MSEAGYLRIANWEKFQNADIFKKSHGKPPWVKLFVHKDYEMESLPIHARLLFYELLKVSGRYANAFPNDSEWLVGEVRMDSSTIREGLDLLLAGAWLRHSKTPRRSRKILESFAKKSPLEENRREKKNHSKPTAVDKSQNLFLEFAEQINLWPSQRLDALNLGPALLEEAMRATVRRNPENMAAYFDACVKGFLTAQRQWKSSMSLEQRLEIYVRNAGYIYEDDDLISELHEKGADDVMVKRLVRVAEEVRSAA